MRSPLIKREIQALIKRVRTATDRPTLVRHTKEVSRLVGEEMRASEREVVTRLKAIEQEREELLELLRALNEALKERLDYLNNNESLK